MTDVAASEGIQDEAAGEGAGEAEAAEGKKRIPGKKIVLFGMLPILLLGLAGAGVYFSGLADGLLGVTHEEDQLLAEEAKGPSVFFEMPDMLVNLNSSGRKTSYLKLSVSIELGSEEDLKALEAVLPRVVDNFQVYLRELRVEDLQGSAGIQRLREELLLRVATAAHPVEVKDVLFREMLIQ